MFRIITRMTAIAAAALTMSAAVAPAEEKTDYADGPAVSDLLIERIDRLIAAGRDVSPVIEKPAAAYRIVFETDQFGYSAGDVDYVGVFEGNGLAFLPIDFVPDTFLTIFKKGYPNKLSYDRRCRSKTGYIATTTVYVDIYYEGCRRTLTLDSPNLVLVDKYQISNALGRYKKSWCYRCVGDKQAVIDLFGDYAYGRFCGEAPDAVNCPTSIPVN